MDSGLMDMHSMEMVQKTQPVTFFGRRSFVPRPLSEATMIFDTDNEEDDESLPSSAGLDNDSQSTLSSRNGPLTPLTGGLGGFEFHIDNTPVKGPIGPHLFRQSSHSATNNEDEMMITITPVGVSKPSVRPFTSLNSAVAELDQSSVRTWTPRQVAEWMAEAGFEPVVVEKFLIHDICGSVLLDLQIEDLKELDISSFGKRHRVMTSIQHLRNSSMVSSDVIIPERSLSNASRRPRTLQRPPKPEEIHVFAEPRSLSRRGRKNCSDIITPAESVSIVAIEQLLPKTHKCSKGETCSKYQRQQRKIQQIQEDFSAETEAKPLPTPSVVASSDVLGPAAFPISAERLSEIQLRDAQENVRQFLSFQHMHSPREDSFSSSSPPPPPAKSEILSQQLAGLPKLSIPAIVKESESPYRTPISAFAHPSQTQASLRAALQNDPYHYGGVASPVDVYRCGTPMSTTDIPVTALPIDPCQRDISQSVPPEMRYGAASAFVGEPIIRCSSTQPASRRRVQAFMPTVSVLREQDDATAKPPVLTNEVDLSNHSGWMRKRKTSRMLRHEWQDHYFNLHGNKLDMLEDNVANAKALETIDVDDFVLHAYTKGSSSKLSAAFKRSIGSASAEPTFAFSLIAEDQKSKRLFEKSKSHHFAVDNGRDRVEWMRKLMLAKALKKNDDTCQI